MSTLQDMFAELRPNMIRYTSIDEINNALIEAEELEREKPNTEKHSDNESQKTPSKSDISSLVDLNGSRSTANANELDENGQCHDDAAESDSSSGSGSIDQEGRDDYDDVMYEDKIDDGSDGYGDDDEDGGLDGSDEDDSIQVRQKVVEVDPKEEEDFDRELRALTQESMEYRRLEIRSRPSLNMTIPMSIFEGSKDSRAAEGESGEETVDEEGGGGVLNNKVRVKVLMKKGHKQQTKQLFIPRDSSLVQSTKQQEAAELEEKQNIKRKILEYNDREEEELNGLLSQSNSSWMAGSSASSSGGGKPSGRTIWEAAGRTTVPRQQRLHSNTTFYPGSGYARRK